MSIDRNKGGRGKHIDIHAHIRSQQNMEHELSTLYALMQHPVEYVMGN